MKLTLKLAAASSAAAMLMTGTANAALLNGFSDSSFNTSVFISVVERNSVNQVVRNLVIDTGARTLDVFAGTPWSTTAAQEAEILSFVGSIGAGSSVLFNIGGGLNDQSFSSDLYGFITSGNADGPGIDNFSALGTGVSKIDAFINNVNGGTFSPANIVAANGPSDNGWHVTNWDNAVGGAILPSNEILLGASSQIIGWKVFDTINFEIVRSQLGNLSSNLATGDISFGNTAVVPLPATVWLLGSALAFLGRYRRTLKD